MEEPQLTIYDEKRRSKVEAYCSVNMLTETERCIQLEDRIAELERPRCSPVCHAAARRETIEECAEVLRGLADMRGRYGRRPGVTAAFDDDWMSIVDKADKLSAPLEEK